MLEKEIEGEGGRERGRERALARAVETYRGGGGTGFSRCQRRWHVSDTQGQILTLAITSTLLEFEYCTFTSPARAPALAADITGRECTVEDYSRPEGS